MSVPFKTVHVIGAGLAGSEAAWQLAKQEVPVRLYEMRPQHSTPAHQTGNCAELVCSNSLRSDDKERNAVGLLHEEMRQMGSLIMQAADANRVPAGGALAVDREGFSSTVTNLLDAAHRITRVDGEVSAPPEGELTLIATGPLTSPALSKWLEKKIGPERLAFFDALAPIVAKDSIDFSKVWKQSRYDKGSADYINCPMNRQQYETFIDNLLAAQKVEFKSFEKTAYFEGCLPIEVMAERGIETLRYGPLKPVGLTNPHNPAEKPWAIVQLRQDNRLGTLWNMVGFQTKLTWGEQKRIFTTIPGLENAEFERLGAIHRNTFIDSPKLLDSYLRLKADPNISFAGQITGVEGYVESAACGLLAGIFMARAAADFPPPPLPPAVTAHGALLNHVTQPRQNNTFEPMNVNFGLFPPLNKPLPKKQRKPALSQRALENLCEWIELL
ncbi:MAG: methylenetetrahydrofolate--tRNA-(uracil(54)-C(5))-methyltransferase (FADH(2)-oxidizing) TrmFO [Magnetococcales bacterium]|nr:methylenetetrahydrofolate--tRNA-(uracil(54)-C(5))-methyltransferase (FADH(2)-oxidizing) TrmFO [Magnetococcales bacterium]